MANFQTKNPDLGKFFRVFNRRCWYIIWPFGLSHSYLVYCVAIWYILWLLSIIFPRYGILHHEKAGNPDHARHLRSIYTKSGFHIFPCRAARQPSHR
jgi:hypothetical protein